MPSGGVTESCELGDPANSSSTCGTGIGMSEGPGAGGDVDVCSMVQGGGVVMIVAGGATIVPVCWSFCCAAFFFKLSLKHLEHIPSKLALPKKPHPWVQSELSSLSIGVAALQQPTPY